MLLNRRVLAFVLLLFCAASQAWANAALPAWAGKSAQFLDSAEVFKLASVQREGGRFTARGQVADSHYIYRHALKLEDAQGQKVAIALAPGSAKHDEFFGDTEIYRGDALHFTFSVNTPGPVTLHWQGCAEAGICYPPQTLQVDLPGVEKAASTAGLPATQAAHSVAVPDQVGAMAEDQAAAQRLASLGPVSGTVLFFGFGLLLAFTPCSLPMIPIVSSMVVGSRASPRRAVLLSLSYVLAMAATYAAVGVAAGLAGANLQAALQSPWLLGAFSALFLILASSLFGLFELQLPAALASRIESAGRQRSGGNLGGAAALGLLSALLVGPCVTAPLAGALLYIGQTGSAVRGGLALFALGLGMGLPLLVIAALGTRVLPRPGAWMNRVRVAFGYVMLAMAVMMLARFVPGSLGLALWGAWLLSVAVGVWAWAQTVAAGQRLEWSLRFGAALAGLWSMLALVGAASGGESVSQPLAHLRSAAAAPLPARSAVSYVAAKTVQDVQARLAEASARGQWTLIDFYADWCASCHVIERTVFGDASIAARLAGMQVIRPDVTRNDGVDQALLKHWSVMGPPTMLLVGPDGQERRDLRVVGEIDVRGFFQRLDAAGIP